MQSLDQSQHSRRQLVTDVISHRESNGWLPRTSLLDQLQNVAAAAATRALVNTVSFCCHRHLFVHTNLPVIIMCVNNKYVTDKLHNVILRFRSRFMRLTVYFLQKL